MLQILAKDFKEGVPFSYCWCFFKHIIRGRLPFGSEEDVYRKYEIALRKLYFLMLIKNLHKENYENG
ncbi:hypothetical protein JZU69_01495, partial [bacterium]|jgi:hypothetical protein|nr:hypothetical protein [bacterium]